MKKFKYSEISDEYTAYNDVDIATFGDIIKQASEMWKETSTWILP